jgi:HEPN domain-containing protein
MTDRPELVEEWFEKVRHDRDAARILLAAAGPVDVIAFHIQQAIEKSLKGFLIGRGWKLARTHDLNELLIDAIGYSPALERFKQDFARITQYYFRGRYPVTSAQEFTRSQVEADAKVVEDFLRAIGRG